jgi:antitoxin component HigA of HigAB toxin-antitoxin module
MDQGLHMNTAAEYRKLVSRILPEPIRNDADYGRMRAKLEKLMVPRPSRAASMLIEVLSTLIENYESREHPTSRIAPRRMLAHCMDARRTTAAQVAKATGIPQDTLSNVLSGRRGISKASAAKLAEYFNLPISAFV